MTIWTKSIIPADPHAWIWAGDMVYLDDNEINCNIFERSLEWQRSCNCTPSYINSPPYSCHAGDLEYINSRWIRALNNGKWSYYFKY